VWAPARDAAGIDSDAYGAFHRLRKTLASVIHESGEKSGRQLSDWLGHSDIAFTQQTYVSTLDSGLGDAEFLDELIPVQTPDPNHNPRVGGSSPSSGMKFLQIAAFRKLPTGGFPVRVKNPRVGAIRWLRSAEFAPVV